MNSRPWNVLLVAIVVALCPVDIPTSVFATDGKLIESAPLEAQGDAGGERPTLFELVSPEASGVDVTHPIDTAHPLKRLYISGFLCGGIAVGDVDGDGAPDLYLVSGPRKNRLYRQVGNFKFEDITTFAGVDGGDSWGAGASLADVDGDGDLDIYVCNYDSPNALYINDGNGAFKDEAAARGVDFVDASLMAAFCDYDRDGDIDFYLLTNRLYRAGGRPARPPMKFVDGKPTVLPEFERYYGIIDLGANRFVMDTIGRADFLLENNGDGTFRDVTEKAGISGRQYGLSATWWDYDRDGFSDLYVGNDFDDPDRLYRNNGDGTFTDVLKDVVPHTSWFSMGADIGDVNNDGWLDLLIADMSATTHFKQKTSMGTMNANKILKVAGPPPQIMRNALYLNTAGGPFMEAAYLTGLADSDWTWAIKFADWDNDGLTDVFISNGMARSFTNSDITHTLHDLIGRTKWSIYEDTPPRKETNLALKNLGDLRFESRAKEWGLDHFGMSVAAAYVDFERDGDLDLVVANLDEPVSLYRNLSHGSHRVLIRLRGTSSNSFGLGSVVTIETAAGRQTRELSPMTGYLSNNEALLHFGLGKESSIRELIVDWPSGEKQRFTDLEVDRLYTVTEPSSSGKETSPAAAERPTAPPLFRAAKLFSTIRHQEQPFDDFALQPLLPNKLSQLGPGMAWGDIDGDGDDDVYFGGAAGQSGSLLRQVSAGVFEPVESVAIAADAQAEDLGALFFDADADGDADLYVVTSNVESGRKSGFRASRLYLNDGHGNFSHSTGSRPSGTMSGGVVAAADYDHDGDLDAFVGGRVVPGRYPTAPGSVLSRNDRGSWRDVTRLVAPDLQQSGMVTGALWSDANDDGWLDLLVTHEWGPVRLYLNDEGTLRDQTDESGLAAFSGWWNGIAGSDLDGDGDIDYVVTNFGLNTKYHASAEKPALIYYGDFANDGRLRIVEAEYEADKLFPVRGKSCSTQAMPFLRRKFATFESFALAELDDLYTSECLEKAERFAATTLESGVLLNDGSGRFEFKPLPRLAQISPAFGAVITEVDGDGIPDVYIVHNFFTPQLETGRMDSGLSLLLKGVGDGTFTPVWPQASGLIVRGDAKSLATTDLNGDGWPDFVVGINDDAPRAFLHGGWTNGRVLSVRLLGPRDNRTAIGARVTLWLSNGSRQTAEVSSASGYLSQSSPTLTFGLGNEQVERIDVRWPNGQSTTAQPADTNRVVIDLLAPQLGK